jgi:hypothetical protein
MGKVADARNKSSVGIFETYEELLGDQWDKTAAFSYQSMLEWLDNIAVQTLTSSHCSPGDTNVQLFSKMIAEWAKRASRTDLAHIARSLMARPALPPGLARPPLARRHPRGPRALPDRDDCLPGDARTGAFCLMVVHDRTDDANAAGDRQVWRLRHQGPDAAGDGRHDPGAAAAANAAAHVDRPPAASPPERGAAARAAAQRAYRAGRRARGAVHAAAWRAAAAAVLQLR